MGANLTVSSGFCTEARGEKVFHFTTNYQCNAAFKNRTGSFKATNIAAAGADVTAIVKETPQH